MAVSGKYTALGERYTFREENLSQKHLSFYSRIILEFRICRGWGEGVEEE